MIDPLFISQEVSGCSHVESIAYACEAGARWVQLRMKEQSQVPVIVDAGIGAPSDAAKALELGADAVLVNTAIAISGDPVKMPGAFKLAVEAGRIALEARLGSSISQAAASSPLTAFLDE